MCKCAPVFTVPAGDARMKSVHHRYDFRQENRPGSKTGRREKMGGTIAGNKPGNGRFPALLSFSSYPRQIQDLGAPLGFIEAGASDFFVPRGYVQVIKSG